MKSFVSIILFSIFSFSALSQRPKIRKDVRSISGNNSNESNNNVNSQNQSTAKSETRYDTLGFEHRNDAKDSIKIFFKFLADNKLNRLDSSIDDFDRYFSVPSTFAYLGNNGAAATSLVYIPTSIIGFDMGFHAFDIYKYTIENTKFYNTTKPFSFISYQLASGKEQMLKAGYTQNINSRTNIGFDYKLITAPGFFVTQNNNHNSYRLFSNYQGKHERYNALFSLFRNNIRASENGGIENNADLIDPNRKDRFTVPVNLGAGALYRNSPFVTTVSTGNHYQDINVYFKQMYDFGKKVTTIINDSTKGYSFYPKTRFQYAYNSVKNRFLYSDAATDSSVYSQWYGMTITNPRDTLSLYEKWRTYTHDISIVQYPDSKNNNQFFLVGISYQKIIGDVKSENIVFNNTFIHGEYINNTKNKLWDIRSKGAYYLIGHNQGDYSMDISLSRNFNKKVGNVAFYFKNINRSQSFIYNNRSAFNLGNNVDYKKENIISFGAESKNPFLNININSNLILNHAFFKNYYQSEQYNSVIHLVQASASKKIKLTKNWVWHAECTFQQTGLSSPIKVPLFLSRNRIAYEGRFFKNLLLSSGIEARYYSAYKAYGYSPVIGQFFVQDTTTIRNIPDISIFAHFRIKAFAGFIRAENLNTANFRNGFSWINNNFAAPLYPTQGFMIRFGIQWWFVN